MCSERDNLWVQFPQVERLVKIMKVLRPPSLRTKRPFTNADMRAVWSVVQGQWCAGSFAFMELWSMIVLAREQLLRLNEIATTSPPSIANQHPVMVSDVLFFSDDDVPVQPPQSWKDAVARFPSLRRATTRMPP